MKPAIGRELDRNKFIYIMSKYCFNDRALNWSYIDTYE